MADATGFKVVGLSESIKLLGSVDKGLRKEAGKIVRKAATQLQAEARQRAKATPGASRKSYPIGASAFTRRATATRGVVGVSGNKYPAVMPAEWGWNSQFVPYRKKKDGGVSSSGVGRFVPQNSMKRRTFPIWRGNRFKFPKYGQKLKAGPGWILQPILRKRLGGIQEQINEEMFELFADSARRHGIPRG